MEERTTALLKHLEDTAKDLLMHIDMMRSEARNEEDEDAFLKHLDLDKSRVDEAWQHLIRNWQAKNSLGEE